MLGRYWILSSLVLLRIVINIVSSLGTCGEYIQGRGDINRVDRNISEGVVWVNNFLINTPARNTISVGDKVAFSGTVSCSLIDRLMGLFRLESATFLTIETDSKTDFFQETRKFLVSLSRKVWPEPEAGLIAGIVLGDKKSIDGKLYQQLVDSGTVHIAVASGFNVMFIGGWLLSLWMLLVSRRLAVWLAVLGMLVYALITGWQAPVIRAVIMGSILMVGQTFGRRVKTIWILSLTAVLMWWFDQSVVWSISFQLTMAACLGIFYLAPKLEERLAGRSVVLSQTELLPTLSTQVLTAPIIWLNFHRLSYIAPLSNILILPLIPILTALGCVSLLISTVSLELGRWVGYLSLPIARLIVYLVSFFG